MSDFSYKFLDSTASAWEAMFGAISTAHKFIYWEVYTFTDDVQGNRFIDLLCEKSKAGVDVKLIFDSIGSIEFTSKSARLLRSCGVELIWYHPIFTRNIFRKWRDRIWQRNHRKILVVDGVVGFVGGVNVHAAHHDWLDLHLQVTGTAVRPLLYGFARSYVKVGGDKKKMRHIRHPNLTGGLSQLKEKINFIFHSPNAHSSRKLKRIYRDLINAAKESVTLFTPYYAPDRDFLRILERAARRGVRIDFIMPARTDVEFMEMIAQKYFKRMQKWGVNIFLSDQMNHSKAMSVDGRVGLVGSVNLTRRSFNLNEEAGVYFTDINMVADLNKILNDWKQKAAPFDTLKTHTRGWWRRTKFWIVNKIEKYVA